MNTQLQATITAIVTALNSGGVGVQQNNITIHIHEAPKQEVLPLPNMEITALRLLLGIPLTHSSDERESTWMR